MSNDPNGAEPESDAERQFNYMLQMEKLQQELDDRSRADFLKSNPFYDGPFDPGMAAAYYGMQAEMESQRQAMLLTNAQRGDINSIREYAAMHDGLIHYEGAEARALFTNLYAMEAARFGRRVPGAPTPPGAVRAGLTFGKLWDDYGSGISHTDKDGNELFSDYCAINLSEALIESGLSPEGTHCWGTCSTKNNHVIRAQELADWLQNNLAGVEVLTGDNFESHIAGKTGIVFFQNYWQRPGEEGRTGDHIDLWNKNEMGTYGMIRTWIRTTIPTLGEYLGMSDLRKSTQILFWEIK